MKQPIKSALVASAGVIAVVGLVVAPTASAITQNVTVEATVNSTISMTTTSQGTANKVSFSLLPGASAVESSAKDAITINCNSTSGYTLTVQDVDATTTLVSGAYTIAASSNTVGSPNTLAVNTWGFATPGAPFDTTYSAESSSTSATSKWAGMPASGSPFTLKDTSAVATNEVTDIWYAAKVDSSKPTGTYSDVVVYTATAK
ncbi:hypothetical protein IPM09_04335 [Candidatus Saccharibacteria bacterium]|nr:MAG: hypothetical protein IPM09_04335 [Candidatus Saccharibacteria bacterium]